MINPNVVEGQIAGGTVQGIAGALFEHLAYDDDGNPIATTFMDYLVPTAAEVPDDRVRATSRRPGPVRAATRASAKAASSARSPAVVNAVADALSPFGVTVNRLPLSPAAVLGLIGSASAAMAAPRESAA